MCVSLRGHIPSSVGLLPLASSTPTDPPAAVVKRVSQPLHPLHQQQLRGAPLSLLPHLSPLSPCRLSHDVILIIAP